MKKYYVTEVDQEQTYMDFDEYFADSLDGIAIYGNTRYKGYNEDLIENIKHALDNCGYDLMNPLEVVDENEMIRIVGYYFAAKTKEDILKLATMSKKYYCQNFSNDLDYIISALTIETGKQYTKKTITGCSQGDWNFIYYPENEISKEYLDLLEAMYFGTGIQFSITESAIEPNELEEADSYFDYTYLTNTKDIKTWAAKNIGCTEDEVVVRRIKDIKIKYIYEYEEA